MRRKGGMETGEKEKQVYDYFLSPFLLFSLSP
jgi:hypothetical protein